MAAPTNNSGTRYNHERDAAAIKERDAWDKAHPDQVARYNEDCDEAEATRGRTTARDPRPEGLQNLGAQPLGPIPDASKKV